MPNYANLSITIRPCVLFSSTITGFARVTIDHRVLLKEIPVFHGGNEYRAVMERKPVAMCLHDLDMTVANDVVWSLREVIELAVVNKMKKHHSRTIN